jgi:hypothetical protein
MFYSDRLDCAYLMPPRTASRSVERWLCSNGFTSYDGRHTIGTRGARRVCVTIRNPWDTLVSWWGVLHEGLDFETWMTDRFLARTSACCAYIEPNTMWERWTMFATRIIRYEQLEADLAGTFAFPVELNRTRDTDSKRQPGQRYQAIHTPRTRALVAEAYAAEIGEFGYGF